MKTMLRNRPAFGQESRYVIISSTKRQRGSRERHRLLHRATIFLNDDVTFAQQHHGEALMIYAIGRRFLSLRIVVEVMCTSGVTPSCELAKKSRVQDSVHLPSKKRPYSPKNGGLPRSAVASPAQQAHILGVSPDL